MNMSTLSGQIFTRLFRHKLAIIGMVILFVMIVVAILADVIAPEPNSQNLDMALTPPMKQIYVGMSAKTVLKPGFVYRVALSSLDSFKEVIDVAGKKVEVEFKKSGKAIEVVGTSATSVKALAPTPNGTLAPSDKIIGYSKSMSTFVSTRQVPQAIHFYKFKPQGEHILPSKESQGAELIDVKEWEDLGIAYLVKDNTTGILRLHAKSAADMSETETEMGPVPKPLLGTDNLGRDIAKRIVHGARISLYVGIVVELISLLIGIPLGAIAGYYGGKLDDVIMRFTDIMLSFPSLLLAMAVMTILGRDIINVFIALGIVSWPSIARIVRGQFISIRESEYVEASRAVGCSNARIIIKHILPNTLAPIIVYTSLGMASAIMSEAGLSFIGIGVRPPMPSWGSIINDGFQFALYYPHLWVVPGLVIAVTVLAFNFLGDGLRDALDPRLKI
ncbi:MAG: ABC transporter permease [Caldiserica bacterium]|nr:ABC transporter permease [Caldisericota bacterium]